MVAVGGGSWLIGGMKRFAAVPFVAAAVLFPVGVLGKNEVPLRVYVGTYTREESRGIYLFEVDRERGELRERGLVAELANPSFLAIHPDRGFLYSVSEEGSFEGKPGGAVSAFAIEAETGELRLLNQRVSGGGAPCHISVGPEGNVVAVANYSGGNVSSFPVGADGSLGERASFLQHSGSGPNEKRQKGPHAHSVNFDLAGRFGLAADLGIDQVRIYRVGENGALVENDPAFARTAPGAGPRHLAFHPDGRVAYVINELDSTIAVFSFDPETGAMEELQTVSTLPAGFSGKNFPAEILVHPSGKFLYGSNRGHDSLAIFAIGGDGKLESVGHEGTRGKNPRGFGIDPSGRFLLAANQDSDGLVLFRIDGETGKLTATGATAKVSLPVCVRFW